MTPMRPKPADLLTGLPSTFPLRCRGNRKTCQAISRFLAGVYRERMTMAIQGTRGPAHPPALTVTISGYTRSIASWNSAQAPRAMKWTRPCGATFSRRPNSWGDTRKHQAKRRRRKPSISARAPCVCSSLANIIRINMNATLFLPPSGHLVGIAKLAAEGQSLSEGHNVEYFDIENRSILTRCLSPRMSFTWMINPYRGCEFACKYCYARYTHEFMEMRDGTEFERKIYVKQHAGWLLRQELKKVRASEQ